MANTPQVTVGAPDDLGLRKILVDGKRVGRARSPRELRRILDRAGVAPGHDIQWLGGDFSVWPDKPVQRISIGFVMVFGLLATAVPLCHIGLSDSGDALTYGGRVAGFTVLVASIVELAAAAAAVDYWGRRRWRYSGVVVLIGVVIAFLCSVALLLLQIGERFNRYTLIGLALAAWSSVALVVLVRSGVWRGLRYPKTIAIGVIVSTFLAGSNLAYSQIYVPYVKTPLVQSGAEFGEATQEKPGAPMYVTVHLYVKNSGEVPVYVLDSKYWIRGGPANSRSDGKTGQFKLVYDGDFVTPVGRVLTPGEEIKQDVVVEVKDPEGRKFEAIKAQTEVYVIRKDRMKMSDAYESSAVWGKSLKEEVARGKAPRGANYRFRAQISNSSEILNVTRGRQLITVWRVASEQYPRIVVDVSPPGERIEFDGRYPKAKKKAIQRYGLTVVRGSMAQTPYPELLEQARSGESEKAEGSGGQDGSGGSGQP
ncbi:hypothetical protein [Streptomyces sp. NPDC091371]|uniref:hypothetical protein n=1 Tax=Streptomyces sp. NPDC091371 TaxID=3155303 RepID=UPI00342C2B2F